MDHFKYLIIGGGMTADAAVQGIRSVDPVGSICIMSAETDPPYNRPPLSKALWKGETVDSIWRKTQDQKVTLLLGRTVTRIDAKEKRIVDSGTSSYSWEKLLLATGCSPRRLPFDDKQIIYFRTFADYRHLRTLAEEQKRFAVIGGGFIGSEMAAALNLYAKEVVMVFPGEGICDRVFPKELSEFVTDFYRKKGVQVVSKAKLSGLETKDGSFVLKAGNKGDIFVDAVVAGVGVEPNVELAKALGLKVDNGIVVDEFLRTGQADIYAAGDVASFFNQSLGKRIRVEHEDNANTMGRQAGRNMAGQPEPYNHLPSFYSDLFELGYEAVGELDSRLRTVVDWKEPYKEGVVYYLENNRVRGVLLWNVWGKVDVARALIAESKPVREEELKGRLH
ncbi:MAG: pyridine nucleotide-disulfide oxidoreductase [Verrucomicrobiales bacterium]|nr:pyridine nucleotide-disulfide oxidoreductase [Verrucomicrobiales bacterium]